MRIALWALAAALTSCASSPPPPAPKPAAAPRATAAPSKAPPARPAGMLYRDEVVAVVDGGLGRFLQKVDVEPSLKGGKFEGFRIVALRPHEFWRGVDLAPGDVVTSVNGMPIERETQAYDAFIALKTSERLTVNYLRNGAPRELVYRIVQR
jgi:type II secretory pathway component PulC